MKRRLALVFGLAFAALVLSWIGISVFSSDPASTSDVGEQTRAVEPQPESESESESLPIAPPPRTASAEINNESRAAPSNDRAPPASTPTTPTPSDTNAGGPNIDSAPDAPPRAINEQVPAASQSALQTIRGTIRVSVAVTIDEHGAVVAATTQDPGPSRYFERLSLAAAKQWTFAPADSAERMALLRFYFTRSGATARAERLP